MIKCEIAKDNEEYFDVKLEGDFSDILLDLTMVMALYVLHAREHNVSDDIVKEQFKACIQSAITLADKKEEGKNYD